MEKGSYGFQQFSRISVLGFLCAILWFCLLIFNYGDRQPKISMNLSLNQPRVNPESVNLEMDGSDSHSENPKVFPFTKAMKTVDNKTDPCGGRYVYIHDLPSRFNEDLVKECAKINKWLGMCKFTMNGGFGPPLNITDDDDQGVFKGNGWYATNHFNLELIFHNRMKQYECLTKDSSIAAAFFVPFYAGFDVARHLWGFNVSVRDATSFKVVDWLQKTEEWKIMNGKDHFLVGGRPTWDFRRSSDEETNWGNKFLLLPAAKNMSMLVIESNPFSSNDFAIPYPTYFHPTKDSDVFEWQDRVRKTERKWLFCFAGAPRPGNPYSIRSLLIDQCNSSSVGKLLGCGSDESKCHSPSNVMKLFQSSVFCLQPQGDSATRRSAFDSILAGCIPVFFHPGSFYTQYTWHLPPNYSNYSVFISEDDIRKNVSIEQVLRQIDPEKIKKMRKVVISLIPKMIYADPYSKLETLEDAFDISLKAIIQKVTKLRQDTIDDLTNDDPSEEASWKYAILEQGDYLGVRKWDPFFAKP